MELSSEVYNLLERFKTLPKNNGESCGGERAKKHMGCSDKREDEIIPVEDMDFSDDETWLYKAPVETSRVKDLHRWLRQECDDLPEDFHSHTMRMLSQAGKFSPSTRAIDSRTYTRPKKRFPRPSIEKYQEELLENATTEMNRSLMAAKLQEMELEREETEEKGSGPLHFDLSQPTTTSIFDKMLAEAPGLESFQNMSPPSLINSMCSSTFTTLMESSYIKNDPVLREIRDADYSETVLLQDSDPPMFQSITDSVTSLSTSDFEKKVMKSNDDVKYEENEDATFRVSDRRSNDSVNSVAENVSSVISTCSTSDVTEGDLQGLSDTRHHSPVPHEPQLNSTIIISTPPSHHNGTYKKGSRLFSSNRNASSSADSLDKYSNLLKEQNRANATFLKDESFINDTYGANLKRNSAGSADSLDGMSSASNASSRGSGRMLNMAEVDAIVELQEQSLRVMSTPKPTSVGRKLCDTLLLSPITGNTLERSDSDLSSNDEYATGRSTFSKASPVNSVSSGASGGVKTVRSADAVMQNSRGSLSNLRTVGGHLRGSYTSLKPVNKDLPEAPPLLNSKEMLSSQGERVRTVRLTRNETFKVPYPVVDAQKHALAEPVPAKPHGRGSSLPRPISTGIPRPVSRIPGLRTLKSATSQPNIKSSRPLNQGSYY